MRTHYFSLSLYLNKVIKLNYFSFSSILFTHNHPKMGEISSFSRTTLVLSVSIIIIYFTMWFFIFLKKVWEWKKIQRIFYKILKLIINGFISSHMARVDFTIILFVFYYIFERVMRHQQSNMHDRHNVKKISSSYFFMIIFTHLWPIEKLSRSRGHRTISRDELLCC